MALLLICLLLWIIIWAYNGLTGRHFGQDIVPVIVFPIIILRPIKAIWRWWFKPALRERNILPHSWQGLMETTSIYRRLLSCQEVILGYSKYNVIYAGLSDARHLLITGVTGEGKTTIAMNILLSLLLQGPSVFSKMTFSLHDAKNVTGMHFMRLGKLYPDKFQIYTQTDESLAALQGLVDEMLARTHQLGESLLFDVNKLKLPHRLIVIDEPQLFYRRAAEYEKLVLELVTAGRQVGFHVILMTPYSKSSIISTAYRVNFRYISGFLPKHAERVVDMPVSKLPRFHFFYQTSERDAAIQFTPYPINPDDIQVTIDKFERVQSGEDIALYIFKSIPNCGVRTLLKQGRAYAEATCPDNIPFPFSEVQGGRWSAAAWQWGQTYLRSLTEQGIATEATPGKARKINI